MTYNEYIQNIINTRGQWNIPDGEYFEAHHIIPRCMGGTGKIIKKGSNGHHPNIIFLYAREHFIAHKLLCIENPNNIKLVNAWEMMAYPKGKTKRDYEITPDEYELLRKLWSKHMHEHNFGSSKTGHAWNKGLTKYTDERLLKVSLQQKGKNTWSKGLKRSEETKRKISDANKKRYLEKPETFKSNLKNYKCCINDNNELLWVKQGEQPPEGFRFGARPHKQYIIKDLDNFKKIKSKQVSGKNNPMYGKGYKLAGGNNGKAIYRYYFLDKVFECRKDLQLYLNNNGYNIAECALRAIQNHSYTNRLYKKYQFIIDNLRWELKNEDKENN